MRRSLRRAQHRANEQVKDAMRDARTAAREWRAWGSQVEHGIRATKSAPENFFERAADAVEDKSERLSQQAEAAAERLEDRIEDRFDGLQDEVEDSINRLRKRSAERQEKTHCELKKLAATRMIQKGRAAPSSFLAAATSSPKAMGAASFLAGVFASLLGGAVILRRRSQPVGTAAPLLG